jgi:16S rRNA G1207 methylase RsmC
VSDHYFSAEPGSDLRRQRVQVEVWGHHLELDSASGVFAAGRVDIGTSVLLRQARPTAYEGDLLDLGCGYGVIACALAAQIPRARVWAVDVNERALQLCRENAARLGFAGRLSATTPDSVPPDVRFAEIWSNPPIRIGKPALHELLSTWLPRLADDGRAVLVVGKNLGADSLQRWIIEQGFACGRLASAKGFRILEVRPGATD